MTAVDSLGRRKRLVPSSTGRRITLRPADLVWLAKLAEHGPLPSSYLLAFTRPLRRSDKRATERLTDLFNEDNTRHGGPYLTRPLQQFRTIDSRYNQLVHDVSPAGRAALEDTGLAPQYGAQGPGPWLHRHMVACTTASIELAASARPDLTYIPGHQILGRAETGLRYPVPIDGERGQPVTKDLIPDALFGLTYHTPDGDRFRFFVVECDRATEPVTSGDWNRKSWVRNLAQYQSYVGNGLYRDHLKLTAPMLVLVVVTDPARTEKMIAFTEQETGAPAYLLFQPWPAFGPVWRPPSPNPDLLTDDWLRAGLPPFRIDRA